MYDNMNRYEKEKKQHEEFLKRTQEALRKEYEKHQKSNLKRTAFN